MHFCKRFCLFVTYFLLAFHGLSGLPVTTHKTKYATKLALAKLLKAPAAAVTPTQILRGTKVISLPNVLKIQPLIKKNYKIKLPLKTKPLKLQKPSTKPVKRETNQNNTFYIPKKHVPLFRKYNYFHNRPQSNAKRSEWEDIERIFGNRLLEEGTTFTPIISYADPISGNRYDEAATQQFTDEFFQPLTEPRNDYSFWSTSGLTTTESLQYYKIASQEATSTTEAEPSLTDTETSFNSIPTSSSTTTAHPTFDYKKDLDVAFSNEHLGPLTTEKSSNGNRRNADGHNEGNYTAHSQNNQGYIPSLDANSTTHTRRDFPKGFPKNDRNDTNTTSRFTRESPRDENERAGSAEMEDTTISSRERQPDRYQRRILEDRREYQFNEDSGSKDDDKTELERLEDHQPSGSHISGIIKFDSDLTRKLSTKLSPSTKIYFEESAETQTESIGNEWQSTNTEISRGKYRPQSFNFLRRIETQQDLENAETVRYPGPGTGHSTSKSDKYNNKASEFFSRSAESISIEAEREPEEFFEDMEGKYRTTKESNELEHETFQREQKDVDEDQTCAPDEPCWNQINGMKNQAKSLESLANKNWGKRYAEGLFINSQNGSFSLGVEKKDGLTTFAFYKN